MPTGTSAVAQHFQAGGFLQGDMALSGGFQRLADGGWVEERNALALDSHDGHDGHCD